MPSAMIHMLCARAAWPGGPAAYWLGSIAPDYVRRREPKDALHLRDVPDRAAALSALRDTLDAENPFEAGWLLHLYADWRWDSRAIAAYRRTHGGREGWFLQYRQEIHLASYGLFHRRPWGQAVFRMALDADVFALETTLPLDRQALADYREGVFRKHAEAAPDSASPVYDEAYIERFAAETAAAFRAWQPQFPPEAQLV